MRPLSDIIEEHTSEDSVDLPAIIEAASAEMGAPPSVDAQVAIQMLANHLEWGLKYVGGLALQTADEVGALPDGFEASYNSLVLALEFDNFRQLYNYKWNQTRKRVEVPGQLTIPVPGE